MTHVFALTNHKGGVDKSTFATNITFGMTGLLRRAGAPNNRVLPEGLYFAFHNNRMTPTQTLRELVQAAQIASRQRGRPFDGLLDLLTNGEDKADEESKTPLSPEEILLRDLVTLAVTNRDEVLMNGYSAAGTLDRQPDLITRLQNVVR